MRSQPLPPGHCSGGGDQRGRTDCLETRDALDGQITPRTTVADLSSLKVGVAHPLTGPVCVKPAVPGDMLEIEITDILPQPTA